MGDRVSLQLYLFFWLDTFFTVSVLSTSPEEVLYQLYLYDFIHDQAVRQTAGEFVYRGSKAQQYPYVRPVEDSMKRL